MATFIAFAPLFATVDGKQVLLEKDRVCSASVFGTSYRSTPVHPTLIEDRATKGRLPVVNAPRDADEWPPVRARLSVDLDFEPRKHFSAQDRIIVASVEDGAAVFKEIAFR